MTPQPPHASTRPVIRNISLGQLAGYKLPPPGVVSILHRISGLLMFLLLPLLLWLLDLSLTSEVSFERLRAIVAGTPARLVLLALAWAFVHHALSGVRFLLLDLHIGVDRAPARRSALIVLVVGLALAAVAGLRIFGVI